MREAGVGRKQEAEDIETRQHKRAEVLDRGQTVKMRKQKTRALCSQRLSKKEEEWGGEELLQPLTAFPPISKSRPAGAPSLKNLHDIK